MSDLDITATTLTRLATETSTGGSNRLSVEECRRAMALFAEAQGFKPADIFGAAAGYVAHQIHHGTDRVVRGICGRLAEDEAVEGEGAA